MTNIIKNALQSMPSKFEFHEDNEELKNILWNWVFDNYEIIVYSLKQTLYTNLNDFTVYTVWRADDDTIHIFSTEEKAKMYADSQECNCVLSTYLVDNPERFYGKSQ